MRTSVVAVLASMTVLTGRARAQEIEHARVRLDLTRGAETASCIARARLVASVERRLRRRVFTSDGAELEVRVRFERHPSAWAADIELRDAVGPLGQRSIETAAPHCSALDDALALVVALLVDTPPERAAEPAVAERSGPPNAAAASPPPPAATPLELPEDTYAAREPWTFDVRASAAVSLGVVPNVGFGPELRFAARPPRGPWLALLADWTLARTAHAARPEAGVRVSSQRLGFDVCSDALPGLSACLGQRVGRLHAAGFGFTQDVAASRLEFAVAIGLEQRIPLSRNWGLLVAARAEVPFTRARLVARQSETSQIELFRAAPVIAVGTIGVGVRL